MPLLAAQRVCDPRNPCRRNRERCGRCEAYDYLTAEDWYLIRFYQLVQDQYLNQTPMGTGKDSPVLITPRMEAYEIALRVYGFPQELWAWLLHWAQQLHRLHRKTERVNWLMETGKSLRDIRPRDLTDAVDP